MKATTTLSLRSLRDLALLAAAGIAAASLWAAGLQQEQGLLLDARTWQDEVVNARQGDWPADGWYRLVARGPAVDVQGTTPADLTSVPADALFVRLPGGALAQGPHASYSPARLLAHPRLGQEYELTLGATQFSLRVEDGAKGMAYTLGYGGKTYSYVLGPFDAVSTTVRLVADLDGDAMPDFDVGVDAATYLLLSTRAVPGANLPAAELASDRDGCC
jgi:hypothetical protein